MRFPVGFLRDMRKLAKKAKRCTRCFMNAAENGKTKCASCNQEISQAQPARLRRNYERDDAARVCVRCHKEPQQPTNKRCVACEAYHQKHKQFGNQKRATRRPPSL